MGGLRQCWRGLDILFWNKHSSCERFPFLSVTLSVCLLFFWAGALCLWKKNPDLNHLIYLFERWCPVSATVQSRGYEHPKKNPPLLQEFQCLYLDTSVVLTKPAVCAAAHRQRTDRHFSCTMFQNVIGALGFLTWDIYCTSWQCEEYLAS